MSIKNLIEDMRQRLSYAHMVMEERGSVDNCDFLLYALRHDSGPVFAGSELATPDIKYHYKFDRMSQR